VRFKDGLLVERDVPPGQVHPKEMAAYMLARILKDHSEGRSDWFNEMVDELVEIKARHVPAD
jgi:hypothetical protein